MVFQIGSTTVPAHKSLVLHRILEKEQITIADLAKCNSNVPIFILSVAKAQASDTVRLDKVSSSDHFKKFLVYCYIETIE